jgi:hypothetical protein
MRVMQAGVLLVFLAACVPGAARTNQIDRAAGQCAPFRVNPPGELIVLPEGTPGAEGFIHQQWAQADLFLMLVAAHSYCLNFRRYPADMAEMERYADTLPRGTSCLITAANDKDPWGQRYRYELAPAGPRVRSAGADRQWDNEDDLALTNTTDPSVEVIPLEENCRSG